MQLLPYTSTGFAPVQTTILTVQLSWSIPKREFASLMKGFVMETHGERKGAARAIPQELFFNMGWWD